MEPGVAGLAILIGGGLFISYAFVCFWTCRRFVTWYTRNLDAFGDKGLVFTLFGCTLLLFGWALLVLLAVQRLISDMFAPKQTFPTMAQPAVAGNAPRTAQPEPDTYDAPAPDTARTRNVAEFTENPEVSFSAGSKRARHSAEDTAVPDRGAARPKLALAKNPLTKNRSKFAYDDEPDMQTETTSENNTGRDTTGRDTGKRGKRSRGLNLNLDNRGKLHLVSGPSDRKEPHF